MKINPFRRRRPRNKRDRNSGNSALRSREADEARWRSTNLNATRLDGDVGHRSISGPTCARGSSWAARRNRRSASDASPICQHSRFIVGLQYKFLGSADPLYSAEWSKAGIYHVPRVISRENVDQRKYRSLIMHMQTQQIDKNLCLSASWTETITIHSFIIYLLVSLMFYFLEEDIIWKDSWSKINFFSSDTT